MTTQYDSAADTLLHIKKVNEYLIEFSTELLRRATVHDDSKMVSPEKEAFDKMTPLLKASTYGSDEYKQNMNEIRPAIDHHQQNNSHHPEYFPNGINGFNLFDLVEMFMDWKAAGERHADGSIEKSIIHNKKRFNISDQLCEILINTARDMNWLNHKPEDGK